MLGEREEEEEKRGEEWRSTGSKSAWVLKDVLRAPWSCVVCLKMLFNAGSEARN